jgi:hypothetical protein
MPLSEQVHMMMTGPMKFALMELANRSGYTFSDLVRLSVLDSIPMRFPVFIEFYGRKVEELSMGDASPEDQTDDASGSEVENGPND